MEENQSQKKGGRQLTWKTPNMYQKGNTTEMEDDQDGRQPK